MTLFKRLFSCFIITALFCVYNVHAAPVAVYLTWQHDPATTMTVQWISVPTDENDSVTFKQANECDWHLLRGTHFAMPEKEPYLIHRVELTNLTPNTDYIFRTPDGERRYRFHTMSNDPQEEIRFVVGGDMYHDSIDALAETNRAAAATNPHFALLGGDIAYTCDGSTIKKTPKKERWMEWLTVWSNTMITPEGKLIPFLPVIGNHDVNGGHNQTPEQAAFFHALFAMPGEQGYNVIDFGKQMSIVILDSGHTRPVKGAQTDWLREVLNERQDVPHKFAIYHVPAYPSYRNYKDEYHVAIRNNWVPLFEQYGLAAAFENHDHAYKRTHLICNNEVDEEKGILYIGDGAWGISKPRKPEKPSNLWYLAVSAQVRHFVYVTVRGDQRVFTAIDHKGEVIDTYTSKARTQALK